MPRSDVNSSVGELMKENLDYWLAALAWAIALATPVALDYIPFDIDELFVWGTLILPLLWVVCVAALFLLKRRPAKKFWWVWLSAPYAFFFIWFWFFFFRM